MKLFRLPFVLMGLYCMAFAYGQSYLPFDQLGLKDGLSHSLVNTLLQDRKGFIWLGAQDGLNRYDGYQFEVFRPDHDRRTSSIYGRWVTQLYEDREGQLWIRFRNGGLNRFDPVGWQFYLYLNEADDPHSIAGDFHSDFRFSQNFKNIIETEEGTLWIGATQGLSRYVRQADHFVSYRHDPRDARSLPGNFITALAEGPDGYLWVGTSKGLARMDPRTGLCERIELTAAGAAQEDIYVFNLLWDSQGRLWIGTRWNGLFLMEEKNGRRLHRYLCDLSIPAHERRDMIKATLETKTGEVWVGGEDGLHVLLPGAEHFSQVEGTQELKNITTLLEDSKGFIWANVEERDIGLLRINPERNGYQLFSKNEQIPRSLSSNVVSVMMEDRSGVLWFGTVKGGVNKLDLHRKPFQYYFHHPSNPNSLNTNDVYAIYEDDHDQLWVGTKKGLNRIDRRTGTVTVYEKDASRPQRTPSANIVGVIEPDPGGFLWLGYYDYKISRFYPATGRFEHFHHHELDPNSYRAWSLRDIIANGPGDTWFGARTYSLTQLRADGQTFRHYANVQPFLQGQPLSGQATDQKINCLHKDRRGGIWIGSQQSGLTRFDPTNGSVVNYVYDPTDSTSISDNEVNCIYEDDTGIFWIGTGSGGLNRFDPATGRFSNFRSSDGLNNNTVHGILPDGQEGLWLSTNRGICRFDPASGDFKSYYAEDGIQSNEFNPGAYFRSADGELFFGGVNGLTSFFPEEIKDNPIRPEVVITALRISNQVIMPGDTVNGRPLLSKAIEYTDEVVLTHRESVFGIEFAALHYAAPGQNRFAYRLEGFDPDWTYTRADKRYITYTNLDPGNYTFRVKASNSDEYWNEEGVSLRISVLPPWWDTPLFRRSMFLLLIGIGVLIVRLRTASLKAQKVRLRKLVAERTQALTEANRQLARSREAILRQKEQIERQKKYLEEMDEVKTRFYTNISHEFRTPLTLILGTVSDLVKRRDLSVVQQNSLRTLERNARRLLRLVSQILDLTKLEGGALKLNVKPGDIITHVQLIADSFQNMARQKDIALTFTANRQSARGFFDEDKLEKIIYNLLHNALKFTGPGGTVGLRLTVTGRESTPASVRISVSDNGPGIPEENRRNIFRRFYQGAGKVELREGTGIGLSLVQQLVSLHHGELELDSRTGEADHGATFTIHLPLTRDAYAEGEIASANDSTAPSLFLAKEEKRTPPALQAAIETMPAERLPVLLLVEDNEDMRAFIRRALRNTFEVLEAGNGAEAFDLLGEQIPDIVLTDVMMPRLNGLEFCRRLKDNPRTSHLPVLILTAKSSLDAELEGLNVGADDYITKPFQPAALQMKLRNIIESRRQLAERYKHDAWMEIDEAAHSPADRKLLGRAVEIIDAHLSDPDFNVDVFIREMGVGRTTLYEKLKAITGLSVNELIKSHRLKTGARLLIEERLSVSEVSYRVGFNDPKYFSKCFKKQFNKSPKEFVSAYTS